MVVQIVQIGCPNKSTRKEGHRSSQCYLPTQSRKTDFCWARMCRLTMCVSWRSKYLTELSQSVTHRLSGTFLVTKETYSCVVVVTYTVTNHCLYVVFEQPSKVSVTPKNTVTTDPVLVKQELSSETRRRLLERKTDPDCFDDKDSEGGTSLGDPVSRRS